MSETKENCPECGLLPEWHLRVELLGSHIPLAQAMGMHPCDRTYESLVGEKADIHQSICPCREWTEWIGHCPPVNFNVNYGHHPNCDGKGGIYDGNLPIFEMNPDAKPTAVDEPELQLLVIDMGESCVVKLEKPTPIAQGGFRLNDWFKTDDEYIFPGESAIVNRPFTELRSAIDGDKPVPRIERCGKSYLFYPYKCDPRCISFTLSKNDYLALSELAGKPLPIYEGGKWERLNTHDWSQAKKDANEIGYGIDTFSYENTICPVKIWRYTR